MADPGTSIVAIALSFLTDGLRWARAKLQRQKAEDQAAGNEVLKQADADLERLKELAKAAARKPPES